MAEVTVGVDPKDKLWEEMCKETEEGELGQDEELTYIPLPNFVSPPERATSRSIGYDVAYAGAAPLMISPNGHRYKIPLGLIWNFPPGYHGRYILRSSLAVYEGIEIAGGSPLIDPDFHEEASFYIYSPLKSVHNNITTKQFRLNPGDRIAQLILEKSFTPPVRQLHPLETDKLKRTWSQSDRKGGYGSTGRGCVQRPKKWTDLFEQTNEKKQKNC